MLFLKQVCFCVLVFSGLVNSQYYSTPCPGVFDFESDGVNIYGKITLTPSGPVSSIVLKITFTVATRLFNVLCTLSFLATGSYQRIVGLSQHMVQRTASRCIRQVVDALSHPAIINKWIVFPRTPQQRAQIRLEFQRRFRLPGIVGCIDCTHVAIVKPSEDEHLFFNRKGYHSLNVQMNYVGRIEADDSNHVLQNYNQGIPVTYRVHFPVSSPEPKVTSITVNGNTICYGPADVPGPNQYVTTLNLQHTSFLQQGSVQPVQPMFSSHNFHRPQEHSEPVLQLVGQLGGHEDTQVYTFNKIDNTPTWTNDYSPYYIVNKTTHKPQNTQFFNRQPSRPIYDNNKFDYGSQGPTYDIDIRDGNPYEFSSKRPVPARQKPQDAPYYPVRNTEAPRPVVTQRPIERQPDPRAPSSNECGVVAGGNENQPLILNGKSYARGDVPWLVAIYKSDGGTLSFICGGTLVSNRHIITAAHCMQRRSELTSIKDFVVKVGVHNLNDWSDDITVTRTIISAAIHESYNSTTLENDILVLTFNKRVEFNLYIRAACLWTGSTEQSRVVGASGVVAGWGEQSVTTTGKPGEPALVRVPIVSTAVCRASKPHFHWLTSATTLCAGDRNGAGPCKGDSGGGLYLLDNGKWRLRGVVSISLRPENGDSTCNLDEYIVFTDTAQYLTWIRSVISENYYD